MNKFNNIFIFIILVFLIMGVVNASDASLDNINTDKIKDVESYNTIDLDTDDNVEDKTIVNDNSKNIKEASNTRNIIVNDDYGDDYNGQGTTQNPYKTIQKAITAANNNDQITLTSDFFINSYEPITIYKNITIQSSSQNVKTGILSGYEYYTDLFQIARGSTVKFSNIYFLDLMRDSVITNSGNLTLDNCGFANTNYDFDNYKKSVLTNYANLTLNNCTFGYVNYEDSDVEFAIINNYQQLNINKCSFDNCYGNLGSALYNRGFAYITNSKFTNSSANLGGVIYNFRNNVTIKNCEFTGNTVNNAQMYGWDSDDYPRDSGIGGVIYNLANCNLYNSTFDYNFIVDGQPHGQSAGVLYNNGSLYIDGSKFRNNVIDGGGGAITNHKKMIIKNSLFEGNYAEMNAGAILSSGEASIDNCDFLYNEAFRGSAILNSENLNNGKMNITNSRFNENYAQLYGTIINDAQLKITNSIIKNNYANTYGSAILNYGSATINNCTLNNNTSEFDAAITNYDTLKVSNSIFYHNIGVKSGAITTEGRLTLTNNLFNSNQADESGAIYASYNSNINITNNIFIKNKAKNASAIKIEQNKNAIISGNTFESNTASSYGGAIYSNSSNVDIAYNKFIKNSAYSGSGIYNIGNNVKIRYNNFTANSASTKGYSVNNKGKTGTASGNVNYYGTKYPSTIENTGNNIAITNNRFDDTIKKIATTTTVSSIKSSVGEKLTLKAIVKDNKGTPIDGGRVIFKLNGITLKDNGKLTGSNNPLKVYVSNGEAVTNIIADLSMKSVKSFSANFIGTDIYDKSNSNTAQAQIKLRTASIVVSSNVKTIKQGQTITLKAQIYDTTNGGYTSNLAKYADEFVYFKVNGITLKDAKGEMIKVKVVNGVATVNYTIPLGLSGITDGKTMTPKNHTILAGFYNKNYQENIRNTSTFQVERSNITITIKNATVNTKTHKLSLTATIRDYLGNIVKGPNKCIIKVNGASIKNKTQALYFYSTNGILNIKDLTIPKADNYKTIEIVTQDRLAYKSQRNTTTIIKLVN